MMFWTRMKFLAIAGGLLAVGAVATAQQAERSRRVRSTVPPPAEVASDPGPRHAAYLVKPARAAADPEIEKEIQKLELSLLEEEVKILHDSVAATLKEIVAYRTSTTTADPRASADAENAYNKARQLYLSRARDLAVAKKKLDPAGASKKAADTKKDDSKKDDSKKDDSKKDEAAPKGASSGGGGVQIGSVDFGPIEAWYARRPRKAANALDEVRQAVGQVARTKGLDVVVRSMNGAAGEASLQVLYVAPQIDITEDVIHELDRRDQAGRKTP